MSTANVTAPSIQVRHGGRVRWAIRDGIAVARRNIVALRRVPQALVFSTIQPVIFVLLFRYVFGGAIKVPGQDYTDFLMPGVFVQTVTFGAIGTAVGMATDLNTGLLERFRSLPMARSAVLVGRTTADLLRNIFVVALMTGVGFLVGFDIHIGVVPFLAGLALLTLYGYVLAWVFATVGLAVGDPETAQAASFPIMAPLVFASSAFVPVSSIQPDWLQTFARHQPVSVTASAVRALVFGGPTQDYVLQALAWSIGILILFVPLAVRRYRRSI
jgi:ABC transporter DrrB family efflux protein